MKHFDLFSGYGGFSLALERVYANNQDREHLQERRTGRTDSQPNRDMPDILGGKERRDSEHPVCIGFSEIDKYASAVLKYHWPNIKNYGDIKKINWAEVPDFDLLTGGSPCQDLSIAGKRAGLEGARSGLFYEYMRAVREKNPKYFIWENVKGALSSRRGFDFGCVLNEMAETGYSLWWQVLNAKDFGVPQNRERIFVIGFRDGSPREIFFESKGDKPNFIEDEEFPKPISNCLRTNYSTGFSNETYIGREQWTGEFKIRRLTPIECERLMGLPDNWTKYGVFGLKNVGLLNAVNQEISDSQRYKLCGNGVVVNVVEEIIKNIIL